MESHDNKIEKVGGYVVYRRKKKRTTSEAISPDSKGCKGKVDDHAETPEHGAEKDRCDKGGRLIFCKACCNSYHPQCLSPPLESIPDGDWQCPNCSNDDDLSETKHNFKTHKKGKMSSYSCSLCSKAKKKLKLSEDETVKSKSSKSSSADKPNASAEFHKCEAGNERVATVSDPGIFGNIEQVDKLLMLSEACVVSMEELHNSYKERAAMQQPDPANSEEHQTKKEGCAKLCASQKDKVALKNKGKEPLSSPRPIVTPKNKGKEALSSPRQVVTPKQSSDLQIVEYDELVALNALTSWKGADTSHSPCMGLSDQDKTTPNSSSHVKNDSASGIAYRFENIDTTTSKRPSGFMKYKGTNMDGWSELELDALWVAVRRHGQGNWEAILADPTMKLLKNKTPQELATRWEEETLKIFPSAVPLPVNPVLPTTADRSTTPHASLDINGNSWTDTTAVQLPSPRVPAHVSGSGTQRFPASLEDEILRRRRNMLSQNHGILGSPNQGSSSSVSHSIRRIGSAPQRASNVNLNPKVSELLLQVQALSQRSNLGRNMRPMSVRAVQTAAEAICAKRHPSSTNAEAEAEAEDEPRLLLGGLFQLPKVVLQKKSESHDTSNTSSKSSQIEEGEGSSHKTTSSN